MLLLAGACVSWGEAQEMTTPADNPHMMAIFAADQAARENVPVERFADVGFVTELVAADAERRAQTRLLLDQGMLRTANDLRAAAFVFQHGETANDYLLAHTLAVAAAMKGADDGGWLAASTLDRYLQKIGQPQVYGTQYRRDGRGPYTQGAYDAELLPDALRRMIGVPASAEQQSQLDALNAEIAVGNH